MIIHKCHFDSGGIYPMEAEGVSLVAALWHRVGVVCTEGLFLAAFSAKLKPGAGGLG